VLKGILYVVKDTVTNKWR